MSSDFLQKKPSKTDQAIYDIFSNLQHLDRALFNANIHLLAVAATLKLDPKAIAELMVSGKDKLEEYANAVNKEMEQLRQATEKPEVKDVQEVSTQTENA